MPAAATTRKIELPTPEELAESPALDATREFINSRALEILCEWIDTPEITEAVDPEEVAVHAARIEVAVSTMK